MPQLDNLTYFSQIFWFFFFFSFVYFFVINNILEHVFKILRLRYFYIYQAKSNLYIISKRNYINNRIVFNFYFSFFKLLLQIVYGYSNNINTHFSKLFL